MCHFTIIRNIYTVANNAVIVSSSMYYAYDGRYYTMSMFQIFDLSTATNSLRRSTND